MEYFYLKDIELIMKYIMIIKEDKVLMIFVRKLDISKIIFFLKLNLIYLNIFEYFILVLFVIDIEK